MSSYRKPLPSYEILHSLLRYEPETGKLYWKNTGRAALQVKCPKMYLRGRFLGEIYLTHRIIYKMLHNQEPPQIDHINHNRADNKAINLRASTQEENHKNRRAHKNNTSGAAGVQWYENLQKWAARVWVGGRKGKNIYLGFCDTVAEAAEVVDAKRKEMGFHPNHGAKNVG